MKRQHQQTIIPVKNLKLMETSQGIAIILWTIRERGPINFSALHRLISHGDHLEGLDADETTNINLFNAARHMLEGVRTLADAGLIDVHNDDWTPEQRKTIPGNVLQLLDANNKTTFEIASSFATLQNLFNISLTDFAMGKGDDIHIEPSFGDPKPGDWPECFVVMPFLANLKPIYEKCILPATRRLNLTCKRGDDFFSDSSIMDEVWGAIFFAKIIICDCTGRNPNVFYEMGMAHTVGRPTILCAQSLDDIPFDVQHRRIIIYEDSPAGLSKFQNTLARHIQDELGLSRSKILDILDKLE